MSKISKGKLLLVDRGLLQKDLSSLDVHNQRSKVSQQNVVSCNWHYHHCFSGLHTISVNVVLKLLINKTLVFAFI